jgi:putative glycosyltransferase (TIGR04348 family)
MKRTGRPRVVVITPYPAAANNGNWHTAARWARFLAEQVDVSIEQSWSGSPCHLLIALHAARSAGSILKFAAAHPDRPLVVVLTGTDLYSDIDRSAQARRSLQLATRLIVLNELGARRLAPGARKKAEVILQSARPLSPASKPQRHLAIAVVGHLRDAKNPQLVWALLREMPAEVPVRLRHVGSALDPALGREAARVAGRDSRYRWLGGLPRAQARQIVRNSHLLLHPSHMEGGAQVVIEAVTAHTAVIASDIDGNTGLLGADYPGLFAENDVSAARALVLRAALEPGFLQRLQNRCELYAPLFAPERERATLIRLVDGLLSTGQGHWPSGVSAPESCRRS